MNRSDSTSCGWRGRLRRVGMCLRPSVPISFILSIAVAGILCLGLIRVVLLLRNLPLLDAGMDNSMAFVRQAIVTGMRFDIVTTFYILTLPTLLLLIAQYTSERVRGIIARSIVALCCLCYSLTLMCNIGDIPFYEHFNTHVNAVAIGYLTNDMMQAADMITGDRGYLGFAIIAIASALAFTTLTIFIARRLDIHHNTTRRRYTLIFALLFFALTPLFARGMLFQRGPMTMRDAFISENRFINDLAKSPEFTLITSLRTMTNAVELMDADEACRFVREELQRDSLLSRHVAPHQSPYRHVIFVVQESSSVARLRREGSTEGLTPHLDSLIERGRYFENVYSTGTHTCHGLYSTITSLPSYININPLTEGLASNLRTAYEQVAASDELTTMFFVTHEPHFDNVHGFTTKNGFERFFCADDYEIPTPKTWGADDHIMFDYAIETIDKEIATGRKVVAMCLTCSNHIPYNAPLDVGFTPTTTGDENIAVQYADWSLGRFMDAASRHEWFSETLFVITGDHGRALSSDYYIPDSFVHIPLLFYAPEHIASEVRSDLLSQMDTTPTAFGLAGLEWDNHTLGIDIEHETRRLLPYGADGCIAVRDYEWVYIYDANEHIPYLYDLRSEEPLRNVASEHSAIVEEMHRYASATTQTGWEIHNNPHRTTF